VNYLPGPLPKPQHQLESREFPIDCRVAVRRKREARYERVVRPLDRKRDALTVEVATRLRALSGGQRAAAQRLLAMITQATASDGAANRV
jgi:ABC-type uncharacterized transport system ATPase component